MQKILNIVFVLMIISMIAFTSCKDCYNCQAYRSIDQRLYDFDENCGTDEEKDIMEAEFREEYPDSLGYVIRCY